MASRSATILVIFIIAIVAFCLASVFGAMTGPISIFPNETDDGNNLSTVTDDSVDTGNSYGYDYNNGYSGSSSSSDVETTTDDSSSDNTQPSSPDESSPSSDSVVVTTYG